jgi:hypothetical protein
MKLFLRSDKTESFVATDGRRSLEISKRKNAQNKVASSTTASGWLRCYESFRNIRNKIKGLTSPPSDNFGGFKTKERGQTGADHIVRKPGCSRTIRSCEAGK